MGVIHSTRQHTLCRNQVDRPLINYCVSIHPPESGARPSSIRTDWGPDLCEHVGMHTARSTFPCSLVRPCQHRSSVGWPVLETSPLNHNFIVCWCEVDKAVVKLEDKGKNTLLQNFQKQPAKKVTRQSRLVGRLHWLLRFVKNILSANIKIFYRLFCAWVCKGGVRKDTKSFWVVFE